MRRKFFIIVIIYFWPLLNAFTDTERSQVDDALLVYPKISYVVINGENIMFVQIDKWLLTFYGAGNLHLASDLKAEWIHANHATTKGSLLECDYKIGTVQGLESGSRAALSICGTSTLTGYFQIRSRMFFFQSANETTGAHLLFKRKNIKSPRKRRTRSAAASPYPDWLFNLTGDTIDIHGNESDVDLEFDHYRHDQSRDSDVTGSSKKNVNGELEIPMEYLSRGEGSTSGDDDEQNGYFYDSAWSALSIQTQKWSGTNNQLPTRWLEIAVAADHTLISFHGKEKVQQYILALMNIVSAIYQDSSLEANIKLVIARLLFYEHRKHGIVRPGNAKKSLENVNIWNRKLHASLKPDQPKHDLAVWLTRSDIGGPSGYAPVGGVCDTKRSCALTKDEGLTSAFIIAHEMAHILGLSHDGDRKSGNDCDQDALEGSVMAPMVAATFSKFSWSECSKREFKEKTKHSNWTCLSNPPKAKVEILLNATLQTAFNMDEQCRMEFGDGFLMCRAFDIIEPCAHLWCGHKDSPLVCKTKKGPPLEGTECGFGKWCVNGYCSEIAQKADRIPVVLNPQHGGWTSWGPWGTCSRTCGIGVQYRSRTCDNPRPSYGGRTCDGHTEESQLCNKTVCQDRFIDLRAQQCKILPKIFNISGFRNTDTWLPYESDKEDQKCKFSCVSDERKEIFLTEENLPDGTPCAYNNKDDICIQGKCYQVGCDGKLNSNMTRDKCGVCGGDNSGCADADATFKKTLKREISRIAVLPRMARHIRVEANVSSHSTDRNPSLAFVLKNRKRKGYAVTIPNAALHSKIVEGTNFFYEKIGNNHNIWGIGPILAEILILVVTSEKQVTKGITLSYNTKYTIHKDFLTPSKRFVWILGGWGPCSSSCGGGKRQKTVACWDNHNNKLVRRKFCSLLQKPATDVELCNTFSCNFKWVPGKWEPCSATCGISGIQFRELYCVPSSIISYAENDDPWKYMVNPRKCTGHQPTTVRPCNRIPCFHYWEFSEWAECSSTCGTGISFRTAYCPAADGDTCGEPPPSQRKVCLGNYTRHTNKLCNGRKLKICKEDESKYCSFDLLQRYCLLKGFRRLCCNSCQRYDEKNQKITIETSYENIQVVAY